jgi:hypothetical protein|nr:MAG TPA_asm: hypothetical protein [Caudoviricetes sp.]
MNMLDSEQLVKILLEKIRAQESLINYYTAELERLEKERDHHETN